MWTNFGRLFIAKLMGPLAVMISLVVGLASNMVSAGEDNTTSASGFNGITTDNGVVERVNRTVEEEGTGNTILKATSYVEESSESVASGGVLLGRAIGSVSGGTGTPSGAVSKGDRLGFVIGRGYDGSGWQNGAGFTIKVDDTVSKGSVPSRFAIETGTNYSDRKENLVVKNNGKVGIGTTSPSFNLDVEGDINFTGNLYKNGSVFSSGSGSGSSVWGTSGTDLYYISGNVGIGTSSPVDILDIKDNTPRLRFISEDNNRIWQIGANTDAGAAKTFGIMDHSAGKERITIDHSGNVGIGTTSPSSTLHVVGGTAASSADGTDITLEAQAGGSGNTDGGNIVLMPGAAAGTGVDGNVGIGETSPTSMLEINGITTDKEASALDVQDSDDVSLLYVRNDGSIGIGTTDPSAMLHVAGDINFTDQKVCHVVVSGNWRNSILVPSTWTKETCDDYKDATSSTFYQLGCIFKDSFSIGTSGGGTPDPNCGW